MNRPNANRRQTGNTTPLCPDCGARAVRNDAAALLPGQPRILHDSTCPTLRAAVKLLLDDIAWLEANPHVPYRQRPLAPSEFAELGVALGCRVPRSQRRRWAGEVTPFRAGVARAYFCDGHLHSVQLVQPDPAGAT